MQTLLPAFSIFPRVSVGCTRRATAFATPSVQDAPPHWQGFRKIAATFPKCPTRYRGGQRDTHCTQYFKFIQEVPHHSRRRVHISCVTRQKIRQWQAPCCSWTRHATACHGLQDPTDSREHAQLCTMSWGYWKWP